MKHSTVLFFLIIPAFCTNLSPILEDITQLVTLTKHTKQIPIVAIAGSPGVGKTHFTKLLKGALENLNIHASILPMDDFIYPKGTPSALRQFHPSFDQAKCHAFIHKLQSGERCIEKQTRKIINGKKQRVIEQANYTGCQVILFEGAFTLCDASSFDFQKYASLKILIDARLTDILHWRWARNLAIDRRGHTNKKAFFKCKVVRQKLFRELIDPIAKDADYIVWKSPDHAYETIPLFKE